MDLGLRLDGLRYGARDRRAATGWRHGTGLVVGPKLGARYQLGSRVTLLGSVSRGFRGAPGVITDPDRPPMTTWAREVGLRYASGTAALHLAAFRFDVANERVQDPVTREISNAGSSVRQGVSFDAEVALSGAVRGFAQLTVNDATISGVAEPDAATPLVASRAALPPLPPPAFHLEPFRPGDPVPGVSRYFGRAGLEWRVTQRAQARALWRFGGPFTPIGEPVQ